MQRLGPPVIGGVGRPGSGGQDRIWSGCDDPSRCTRAECAPARERYLLMGGGPCFPCDPARWSPAAVAAENADVRDHSWAETAVAGSLASEEAAGVAVTVRSAITVRERALLALVRRSYPLESADACLAAVRYVLRRFDAGERDRLRIADARSPGGGL